jgi:Sulfotransferase family
MHEPQRSHWPIILGGCPRSGTSLLRRMLDSHTRIHCGPEVKFFPDLYGDAARDRFLLHFMSTARTLIEADELLQVLGPAFVELHDRAAQAAGKARWADKAPENVLFCGKWEELLGQQWLLVHVLRNPLDTIASIREARFLDVPTDLTAQIVHYRACTEAGFRFAAEHPERYRAVVYEQLVAEPEETVRTLMAWLGEQFESQQLAFNELPHQPGSEDHKVRQTTRVHAESLDRWARSLADDEAEMVWELTADLWTQVDADGRFVSLTAIDAR